MRAFGDILINGGLLVLALVTLLAAGDLAFRPEQARVREAAAPLAAGSALAVLALQYLRFLGRERRERVAGLERWLTENEENQRQHLAALEQERAALRQRVESLCAHREISLAASSHSGLADFLTDLAGVVHDLAGVRDLTVFLLPKPGEPLRPRAHYRLGRTAELLLWFGEEGAAELAEKMQGARRRVSGERLLAQRLSLTPKGARLTVGGTLVLGGREIGEARLTLGHVDPQSPPPLEKIERLMEEELARVDFAGVDASELDSARPALRYDGRAKLVEQTRPLIHDGETLGAVKVRFARGETGAGLEDSALHERTRLLDDSAQHIARAIRAERLYEQAIKDALTGLFNKRYMLDQLENHLRSALRHGTPLTLILLDIDHFKKVNDTHGHLTGDIVLKAVATVLRKGVRACDFACRYGGEEMAVILPEGDLAGAAGLAERLRAAIEACPHTSDKGVSIKVTSSLGVAQFAAGVERGEDLIARADAALYHAKESGRNQVMLWNEKTGKPGALSELPTAPSSRRRARPLAERTAG